MIFTLTTTNEINSTGTVVVTFPITRRWTNDVSTTNYMPIASSMVCSNQSSVLICIKIECKIICAMRR
jgi:hypothetical protein